MVYQQYRYFIPKDGDSEQHLNVFLTPKSRQASGVPTLGEIQSAFRFNNKLSFLKSVTTLIVPFFLRIANYGEMEAHSEE
jgi:hypothetical protein